MAWGGWLGSALFHAVRCTRCRKQYNVKTGASLTRTLIIFEVVGTVVAVGLYLLWRAYRSGHAFK